MRRTLLIAAILLPACYLAARLGGALTLPAVPLHALWTLDLLLLAAMLLAAVLIGSGRLEKAQTLHAAVLRSIHDQIVVTDQDGRVVDSNDVGERHARKRPRAPFSAWMTGDNLLQAGVAGLHARNRNGGAPMDLADALHDILRGRVSRHDVECSVPGDDGLAWFLVSMEPLRRREGGAVIRWSDNTERTRAAARAQEQHDKLTRLSRAAVLGEMSGTFAHELGQPLTSILGNAEACLQLLQRDRAGNPDLHAPMNEIIAQAVRASELVKRLRSMLLRGETQRAPVDLNSAVREALDLAHTDLTTRNVAVALDFDNHLPPVSGDRIQLQQVVLNIVMNACEAMADLPPPRRLLSISTRDDPDQRSVTCRVRDCGPGIADADMERIFQPFVTTRNHGMGLGLTICQSIIEHHGGRLWAENCSDGGAAISFSVRIVP